MSTPSLAAQGEQRRSAYFNINRDNSANLATPLRAANSEVDMLGAIRPNARRESKIGRRAVRTKFATFGSGVRMSDLQLPEIGRRHFLTVEHAFSAG